MSKVYIFGIGGTGARVIRSLTMLLAASVVIGDLVPGDLVLILYGLFFPMIIVFLAIMIKKLEPKI